MSDEPKDEGSAPEGLTDVEFPEPPSDEEIRARLAESKSELEEAKAKYDEARDKPEPGSAHSDAVGMSIAYAVLILPTVGAGAGWLIDRSLGGTLFTVLGLLAGGIAALVYAARAVRRK